MSHHLALLINQAEADTVTTTERIDIVRLLLDLWAHRRDLPRRRTADPFDELQRTMLWLTENSPWPHAHRRYLDDEPDPVLSPVPYEDSVSDSPDDANEAEASDEAGEDGMSDVARLLGLTRAMETTTREAALRLLWLAAEQASQIDAGYLDAADRIKTTIESRTTITLRRHADLERRLRLQARTGGDEAEVHLAEDADDATTRADETGNLLADTTLAAELRKCATDLLGVADALDDRAADAH